MVTILTLAIFNLIWNAAAIEPDLAWMWSWRSVYHDDDAVDEVYDTGNSYRSSAGIALSVWKAVSLPVFALISVSEPVSQSLLIETSLFLCTSIHTR